MATILSTAVTSTAYKITKTVTGVECDMCNEIIPVKAKLFDRPDHYFEVMTGHNDWGNDSVDSYETHDICPKCVAKFIEDYLKDCRDTAFLRLDTKTVYPRERSEVVDELPDEGEVTKEEHGYW